mmetsp:Transcript_25873/g.66912  ORF Transcript_25873/g.66912 Transcript_25873/m.66912 type:complete len:252 (+) Transcript_25873:236-991(+)
MGRHLPPGRVPRARRPRAGAPLGCARAGPAACAHPARRGRRRHGAACRERRVRERAELAAHAADGRQLALRVPRRAAAGRGRRRRCGRCARRRAAHAARRRQHARRRRWRRLAGGELGRLLRRHPDPTARAHRAPASQQPRAPRAEGGGHEARRLWRRAARAPRGGWLQLWRRGRRGRHAVHLRAERSVPVRPRRSLLGRDAATRRGARGGGRARARRRVWAAALPRDVRCRARVQLGPGRLRCARRRQSA